MTTFPKHLRVAVLNEEALETTYTIIGRTPVYKVQYQFLLIFSKFLNFSYTIVMPEDGIFGHRLKDGNWTGVVGMMQRGEADIAFKMMEVSHEIPVDHSFPVTYNRITFMTQRPQPILKNFVLLQPFSGAVWGAFLLSALVFFSLFCFMSTKGKQSVRTFFATLGNVLGQPFSVPLTTKSQVFLFFAWIIPVTFLILFFKSIFLSFLLAVPTKGISTIDELASAIVDGSVKCKTLLKLNNSLRESTYESYRIIQESLLKTSREKGRSLLHYINPYSSNRTCLISYETSLVVFNGMFVSQDSLFYAIEAFLLRKNFRNKKLLDKTVERMLAAGLFEKIIEDNNFLLSLQLQLLFPPNAIEREKGITLEDFVGAFLILVTGLALALLVLLGEIIFFICHRD